MIETYYNRKYLLNKNYILICLLYLFIIGSLFLLNRGLVQIRELGVMTFLVVSFFIKIDTLVILVAAVEPFSSIFKFNNGFSITPLLFIVLIIKCALYKRTININKAILIILLFLISSFESIYRYGNLSSTVSFYIMLISCVMVISTEKCETQSVFFKVAYVYILSVLIECISSRVFSNIVQSVVNVDEFNLRNIGFSNEWDFGRHIVIAIAFVVVYVVENRKHYLVCSVIILMLLSNLISTGLYSGLVGLAVMIACFPFCVGDTKSQRIKYFIILSFVVVVLAFIVYQFIFLPMYELRGQIGDNGRFDIWGQYIHDLITSPSICFFGIGGGCINDYADLMGRLTTHNIVLEKIMEFGIIGIAILVLLFWLVFRDNEFDLHVNRKMLPLIAFLGTSLTQGITGNEIVFILIVICYKKKQYNN